MTKSEMESDLPKVTQPVGGRNETSTLACSLSPSPRQPSSISTAVYCLFRGSSPTLQALSPQGPGQGALHSKDAHLLMRTMTSLQGETGWLGPGLAEPLQMPRVWKEGGMACGGRRWQGCHWPLAPEHSSVTSIDLLITSWKGSFICQAKLPLYLQHRN